MRDFRDAKAMAQSLRQALSTRNITVSHSDSLELIAQSFGFDNWNILSAKIGAQRSELASGDDPESPSSALLLHCSFCGKSQDEVKKLIAGPDSFICDECVHLCVGIFDREEVLTAMRSAESEGRDPRQGVAEALSRWGEGQVAEFLKRSQDGPNRPLSELLSDFLAQHELERAGRPNRYAALRETVPPNWLDQTDETLMAMKKDLAEHERLDSTKKFLAEHERLNSLIAEILETRPASQA